MNEESLFALALEIQNATQRKEFLDDQCQGDPSLRNRVEALLVGHQRSNLLDGEAVLPVTEELTKIGKILERPGAVIGPYKLLEQIGEGGFGLVFVAAQEKPVRRRVALKLIKPGMDSGQIIARFEAERQALAMMEHGNIAKVFDAGTTEHGRPYFVMELVHGIPITEYCDRNKLTPRQRLELFVPVCHAIHHAHQKGVIHRDIKPSNVLVTMYDDRPVPKVIDFGIAKAIDQQLSDKTVYTQFGTMVGTLEYVSPEQSEMNAYGVDTRSDIYSLGVLLYELLTGTTPIERNRLSEAAYGEIVRIIQEEDPPRPSLRLSQSTTLDNLAAARNCEPAKLSSLVRGELDWIVMRCLEKDRTRRYEGANTLAKDVERFLSDEPVEACPPTLAYRVGKLYRKHRVAMLTATSFVLVLLISTVTSLGFAWKANESQQIATANAHKATENEVVAQRERDDAIAAKKKLAGVEYALSMQLAHREWHDDNLESAKRLLARASPERRGWEWRYLNNLCAGELLNIKAYHPVFNSDGSRILTSSNQAHVRDAKTGQILFTLRMVEGEGRWNVPARYSPDGTRIAACPQTSETIFWDALTGKELNRIVHDDPIGEIAFSPDGSRLATASKRLLREEKTFLRSIEIWDVITGEKQARFENDSLIVLDLSFSPDGSKLLTANYSEDTATVWDAGTGERLLTLEGHEGVVQRAEYNQHGDLIVTAGTDGTVKIWDAATGQLKKTLVGHKRLVRSVRFSPDDNLILSGSDDRTVRVWDVESGATIRRIRAYEGSAVSVAFHPIGELVMTADRKGGIKLWNPNKSANIEIKVDAPGDFLLARYCLDGRRILVSDLNGKLYLVDPNSGTIERTMIDPELERDSSEMIRHLTIDPTGKRALTNGADRIQRNVWDLSSGKRVISFKADIGFSPGCFSPDGKRIMTQYEKGIRVHDSSTGEVLNNIISVIDSPRFIPLISCSPNGKLCLRRQGDFLVIADVESGKEVRRLGPTGLVFDACFSPAGSEIVTVGHKLQLWDVQTGKPIREYGGHSSFAISVAFSPDGKRLVSSGDDATVRLWDTESGQELLSFPMKSRRFSERYVSFSPDGSKILTTDGSIVKIFDAAGEPARVHVDSH